MKTTTNAHAGWTREDESNRERLMAECLKRDSETKAAFLAGNPPPTTGNYKDEDEYDMVVNDSAGENGGADLFGAV